MTASSKHRLELTPKEIARKDLWMQQQAISAATTELMPVGLMDAHRRQSTALYEAFNKLLEATGKQPGTIHCGPQGELYCLLVPRAQAEELLDGKAAILAETESGEGVYIYDPRYTHRGNVHHMAKVGQGIHNYKHFEEKYV